MKTYSEGYADGLMRATESFAEQARALHEAIEQADLPEVYGIAVIPKESVLNIAQQMSRSMDELAAQIARIKDGG